MKISRSQLRRFLKEELGAALSEAWIAYPGAPPDYGGISSARPTDRGGMTPSYDDPGEDEGWQRDMSPESLQGNLHRSIEISVINSTGPFPSETSVQPAPPTNEEERRDMILNAIDTEMEKREAEGFDDNWSEIDLEKLFNEIINNIQTKRWSKDRFPTGYHPFKLD